MWDGGFDDGKPEWLQKSMLEREREKFEMRMDSDENQGATLLPFPLLVLLCGLIYNLFPSEPQRWQRQNTSSWQRTIDHTSKDFEFANQRQSSESRKDFIHSKVTMARPCHDME